jgi:hypothetical protein
VRRATQEMRQFPVFRLLDEHASRSSTRVVELKPVHVVFPNCFEASVL